jgi:hypothetical protein
MTDPTKQQEVYDILSEVFRERQYESPVEMCRELMQECDSTYVIDMMLRDKFGLGLMECALIRKQAAKR